MWFFERNGAQEGPVEAEEIRRRLGNGELSALTLVWREGMENWVPLGQVAEFEQTPGGGMMPQPQPMNPAMMPPALNNLALTSMILGILSLVTMFSCFLGILFAVPGVICGHISRGQLRKSPLPQTGDGMALAGLITSYCTIVLTVALGIAMVVGFSLASKTAPTTFPPPSSSPIPVAPLTP